MITSWIVNLAAYSLQLAVLVGSALAAGAVLRLRAPRPALAYWQAVLAAAVILPLVQGGVAASPADSLTASATLLTDGLRTSALSLNAPRAAAVVLGMLACGAAARIGWLAVGLVRLRAIRHRSRPLSAMPPFVAGLAMRLGVAPAIHVSNDIGGPVTIGLRRPLVLLPPRALDLPVAVQQAIICHELLHVQRRDWVRTLLEELWCALLWFHPAAHVLVSRVSLMREALVDRATLALTHDRPAYARALLTFAEPDARVPAAVPSLIRPRHLSRRIALIAQEPPMSHVTVAAVLVAGLTMVSAATAASVSRFPMVSASERTPAATAATGPAAQDSVVRPGNGVTLPRVVKEVRPEYTEAAMKARIQGDVEMDVVVLPSGDAGKVVISRSLDAVHGLDDAAVQAASQWKFEPGRRDGKAVPVLVTLQMTFALRDRK